MRPIVAPVTRLIIGAYLLIFTSACNNTQDATPYYALQPGTRLKYSATGDWHNFHDNRTTERRTTWTLWVMAVDDAGAHTVLLQEHNRGEDSEYVAWSRVVLHPEGLMTELAPPPPSCYSTACAISRL